MSVLARRAAGAGFPAVLLTAGLTAALGLRVAVAGPGRAASSPVAALVFAAALLGLAAAAGWRPTRPALGALAGGVGGAAVLCLPPLAERLAGHLVPLGTPPAAALPGWALAAIAVAVTEEVLIRGALWDALERPATPWLAPVVTTVAFGLVHVPLYGWSALPLDLAAGAWLGALRQASGGIAAPATAHCLADLAWWWLR